MKFDFISFARKTSFDNLRVNENFLNLCKLKKMEENKLYTKWER